MLLHPLVSNVGGARAVLQGFGVGDAAATAAAATMTHLLRDATSKVGKIHDIQCWGPSDKGGD